MPMLHRLAGSVAALTLLTTPVVARGPDARQAEELAAPASCHSLEKAADGNWISIPCQELGTPAPPQRKAPDRSAQHASH